MKLIMKINETNNNSQQKFNIVTIQRKKRMVNKMHNLSKNDYIKILKYYNIRAPKSSKTMKKRAEQILADKMCRCIQKIGSDNPISIGVCTRTVINNKGYIRGNRFTCKKGRNSHRSITLKKRAK